MKDINSTWPAAPEASGTVFDIQNYYFTSMHVSLLRYSPVNLDKLEYYLAICTDSHLGKDPHCRIQGHSIGQLTWPDNKIKETSYAHDTMIIDFHFYPALSQRIWVQYVCLLSQQLMRQSRLRLRWWQPACGHPVSFIMEWGFETSFPRS